jgi:hypothetical protein
VAADFTTVADFDSLLNFDKSANPCFVADLAAVKVDKSMYAYISTQFHIWRDTLVVGQFILHSS